MRKTPPLVLSRSTHTRHWLRAFSVIHCCCCCTVVMVQADYHQRNPYHNSLHATDVTQAMYCFLRQPKVSPPWTRPWHWVLAGHWKRGTVPIMTKGDDWNSFSLTDWCRGPFKRYHLRTEGQVRTGLFMAGTTTSTLGRETKGSQIPVSSEISERALSCSL